MTRFVGLSERLADLRNHICSDCGATTIEHGKCDDDGHYQMGRVCLSCSTWTWGDNEHVVTSHLELPLIKAALTGESLWDLQKRFEGIDPAAELPASLDARRAAKQDDGLTHCVKCGGQWFNATISLDSDGRPAQLLPPQTCVGCGQLRQGAYPPS